MWSEDRLHRWLARRLPSGALAGSRLHDAVVLRADRSRPALCVDQTIAGVHFDRRTPPRRVGAKAAGRALSDLAAAAARPRALLLALAAPAELDELWLRRAITGVMRAGEEHGAELVGGDLARTSGPATLAVTALGRVTGRGRPPGRDRARAGQVVVLTGAVGGSSLGRHLRIRPRIAEGIWLHARGATAMMDVSDGLAWDLFRLARSSGVRVEIEEVPVHPDAKRLARRTRRSARDHALHDGEDYELVATLPARAVERVLAEAPRRCPGLQVVGRVRRGRGVLLAEDGQLVPWSGEGGWRHGG